jgi:hypothetical protein
MDRPAGEKRKILKLLESGYSLEQLKEQLKAEIEGHSAIPSAIPRIPHKAF